MTAKPAEIPIPRALGLALAVAAAALLALAAFDSAPREATGAAGRNGQRHARAATAEATPPVVSHNAASRMDSRQRRTVPAAIRSLVDMPAASPGGRKRRIAAAAPP